MENNLNLFHTLKFKHDAWKKSLQKIRGNHFNYLFVKD